MSCSPCARQPVGPSDAYTRQQACWWVDNVIGNDSGQLSYGGRLAAGFALHGFGLGATSDANLLAAAQAVTGLNLNWGGACAIDPTVQAFQSAWNATSDSSMPSSTDNNGNPIGQLTVDGKYGPETAAAVQAALGSQSPTPCTSYTSGGGGGGGGGGYSAGILAAAQALDSYLASNGCSACANAGQPPMSADPLAALVSTFKNAILTTPGNTSSASPTVTGSTINMSSAACQQSYGPGTVNDLRAVLGSSMQSSGQPCTDSSCNCLTAYQGPPGPPAPPGPTPPGPTPPAPPGPTPPAPASSGSSSNGPLIAGAIVLALGAGGVYYAAKRRKRSHASAFY